MSAGEGSCVSVARLLLGCSTRALARITSLSVRNVGADSPGRGRRSLGSRRAPACGAPNAAVFAIESAASWSALRCRRSQELGAFVILLVVFRALELPFRGREKRLPILRRGLATDAAYWLFTPFVTKAITRVCVAAIAIPFAVLVYGRFDRRFARARFRPRLTAAPVGAGCRHPRDRRLCRLLDASRLSRPAALAVPRRPSFVRRSRLAVRGESATGQRCPHASCRRTSRSKPRLCADRRCRHCAGPARSWRSWCTPTWTGIGFHCGAWSPRRASTDGITPQSRKPATEFRGPAALVGYCLWHLLHAEGQAADRIRNVHRCPCRAPRPNRVPFSARDESS